MNSRLPRLLVIALGLALIVLVGDQLLQTPSENQDQGDSVVEVGQAGSEGGSQATDTILSAEPEADQATRSKAADAVLRWHGQVISPPGAPADDTLEVVILTHSMSAGAFGASVSGPGPATIAGRIVGRAAVDSQGAFEIPTEVLPKDKSLYISLDGRSPAGVSADAKRTAYCARVRQVTVIAGSVAIVSYALDRLWCVDGVASDALFLRILGVVGASAARRRGARARAGVTNQCSLCVGSRLTQGTFTHAHSASTCFTVASSAASRCTVALSSASLPVTGA